MAASYETYKAGYEQNWNGLVIRKNRMAEARERSQRLLKGKKIYQQIEKITGVPWWFVGVCHYRESSFDFETYLGNGQPLSQRTTIVPKNRGPFLGPNAFVDGAVDALRLENLVGLSDWSISRVLYRLEGFNGYGYHARGVNSPYLYGGSKLYGPPEAPGGKFVRDHIFDPAHVDTQLGTAVILKVLQELDADAAIGTDRGDTGPQADEDEMPNVMWIQRALNRLGAEPVLVEDGRCGPKTRRAISMFQQSVGLEDTGIADMNTVAELHRQIDALTSGLIGDTTVVKDSPRRAPEPQPAIQQDYGVRQRHGGTRGARRVDLSDLQAQLDRIAAEFDRRLLALVQNPAELLLNPGSAALDSARKLAGAALPAPLGPVNGALGNTIGQLLNGKKSAIGVGGAVLTQILSQVPASTGLGQVLTLLTPAAGLSPYTMPLFLGLSAWGVLGKLEKWTEGMQR